MHDELSPISGTVQIGEQSDPNIYIIEIMEIMEVDRYIL